MWRQSIRTLWHGQRGLLLFLCMMLVFRSAVADWNYVPSSSMNPTLWAGDRVAVNKLAYSLRVPFTLHEVVRWEHPQVGDVITFDSPVDGTNLIKRVVATGGDTVAMRDNVLVVNGHAVTRTMTNPEAWIPTERGPMAEQLWREHRQGLDIAVARLPAFNRSRDFAPVVVPAGHVMVMGDNRDNSNDSRFIGFIDEQRITGQAVRVVMSHDPQRMFAPRADRWWLPLHL
ncbi:signal peptidase I [uncultured Pseudacidovorax sp.]|uniref:signal peptidase I n=1 Tax=uncultured Pseudacidovorax sp. TaxID=679313 RepID=UPI0025FA83E3|nr:signal peptidase I [uncultured Pseudacidovorax sp.]